MNWREIERIRKNPDAFRSLAKAMTALRDLTEWEMAFLESIQKVRTEEFTNRQGEKLLEIRDQNESIKTFSGFSVAALLKGCLEGRADLSEDDESWITSTCVTDKFSVKRRGIGRLMRCAAQLGLVEVAE